MTTTEKIRRFFILVFVIIITIFLATAINAFILVLQNQ